MFAELFENVISMSPIITVIPMILVILIVKKSVNKIRLKKFCVIGFFVCMAWAVLSEAILYTDAIQIVEDIAEVMGGLFFALFYYIVQAFCFTGGITLAVTYIILTIHNEGKYEKIQDKF
ncbi:MAG: hypothetical protein K2G36_11960 [Ruminococcus sp.]|nr:hypothetical protein [Ruminococcus sp.]